MAITTDNKASRLFKALMGVSETKTIRDFFEEPVRSSPAVLPNQVWQYGNWIPTGALTDPAPEPAAIQYIQNMQADQAIYTVNIDPDTSVSLIKRWINCQLTMIDAGTDNSFKLVDAGGDPIKNIIPFNFGDGTSYNYSLYKNDGTPIAFGIGDWVFDPNSGVLTFYSPQNVTNVSHLLPPKMSFYQYIGGLGIPNSVAGYDGAILPLTNYNGGSGVTTWSDSVLDGNIVSATNAVQNNFISLHGWTGSDTAIGVAVAFQKLIPLVYSASKDPVATGSGIDAAQVMTLMARRNTSPLQNISGFVVDFISQGAPVGSLVRITYNASAGSFAMSFDGGNTWGPIVSGGNTLTTGQAIKVKNGSDFTILRRIPGLLPSSNTTDTLTVTDQTTKVALLMWNTDANDFLPYVNTDSTSSFNFGFPIVMKLGKIPPSLKLGQTSGGGFSDVITPEYYGTRPTSVVLAVQDTAAPSNNTANASGADFVVTNTTGGYLGDIITKIYNANPNFVGEILLRQGRYKVNSDITFNGFTGLKIKGETPETAVIDANGATRNFNVQAGGTYQNDLYLYDVTFSGTFNINTVASGTNAAVVYMRGIVGNSINVNVGNNCGITISECGSLGILTVTGSASVIRSFESSAFNTINLNGAGSNIHGCTINTLVGDPTVGITNTIIACQINTLTSLNENNQYIGNSVTNYGASISAKFKMSAQKFEIIDSDGVTRRWTGFAGPIIWDNIAKLFELNYDTAVMSIDGNGKLTVNLAADLVTFASSGVIRADGTSVTATNVQNALVDLYANKADLDVTGKINLNQLPSSIAGGAGLMYKGMWEFDANGGAYPTGVQLAANTGEIGSGTALQPGWFVVVSSGTDPTSPATPQTAALQSGEVTPLIFTAGDWAVWNGAKWEKVDNSFADPSYTILPVAPPGGAWTDGLLTLGGTTLVDGVDQINEILLKLAPPKPVNLSTMSLAFKTAVPYTAAESGSGTVRSAVTNNTQPAVTTPTGVDSVNTLFYDGESGTLTASLDSTPVGTRLLSAASDIGVYSALNITADNDPWTGVAGKQNFWKGLRAEIDPTAALALGVHTVSLSHSISGTTPTFTFYVDNPAATMSITGASITTLPPMSKYLSGVPSVQPSSSFVISAFNAVGVVGQYYNSTEIASVACNVSGVSTAVCAAVSVPATPTAGTYNNASAGSKTLAMPSSAYSESINFTLTPYNSRGTTGSTSVLTSGYRIDTTVETERVYSGDPTATYPTDQGAVFDSTQSIVAGTYTGELQKINGHYQWPANISYASFVGSNGAGPNYIGASGATVGALPGVWRWVTYKFVGEFSNNSAFTITFNGASGFNADTNQVTANMLVYAKVVGASGTGWLNANAPYSGAGTPAVDGDTAMVAGSSTSSVKRITFGTVVRTGDLYIRVAINSASGIQFSGVTIGSLA